MLFLAESFFCIAELGLMSIVWVKVSVPIVMKVSIEIFEAASALFQ